MIKWGLLMVKTTKEIKDNYIIVTDKWLRKSTSNNHKVIDRNYFADSEGNIYKVDGKYVVLDYSIKKRNSNLACYYFWRHYIYGS